jgi:hypothetical protein
VLPVALGSYSSGYWSDIAVNLDKAEAPKARLLPDILAQSAAQKAAAIYFCGSIITFRES